MKYLGIVFLAGLFFGFSGIANAASPTIDDVYQMLLEQKEVQKEQKKVQNKQQEKIASLEANQRSLERDVTQSKLREARLRDELHNAKKQLASVQKAASHDFGEPTYDVPQREEGFVVSAGALNITPILKQPEIQIPTTSDLGFSVSASYQADDNLDYLIRYKHLENTQSWRSTSLALGGALNRDYEYILNNNQVDFELGKKLDYSNNTSLRLFAGLRYAVVEESLDNLKNTCAGCGLPVTNPHFNVDLWGIGLRAGVTPEWRPFDNSFRIFSSLSGALLAGEIDYNDTNSVVGYLLVDDTLLISMVEASVGLGYLLPTGIGDFDIKARYQYEKMDVTEDTYFEYRGYHGFYGSIGYAFGDIN